MHFFGLNTALYKNKHSAFIYFISVEASDTTNDEKLGYSSSYPQQQQSFDGNRSYDDNDSSPTQKPAEAATKRRKETRYNNEFNRCYEGYEKTAAVAAERCV